MLTRKTLLGICIGFVTLALVGMAFAQPTWRAVGEWGGRGGGGRGGFGGRGGGPEQFLQMMTERMKERLEVGDEEWKVIQPRLTKVVALQFQVASVASVVSVGAAPVGVAPVGRLDVAAMVDGVDSEVATVDGVARAVAAMVTER